MSSYLHSYFKHKYLLIIKLNHLSFPQLSQAQSMGLPQSVVPEMVIPPHDEMDRDLRLLTQQQEKLMAEMQKTAADENKDEVCEMTRLSPLVLVIKSC